MTDRGRSSVNSGSRSTRKAQFRNGCDGVYITTFALLYAPYQQGFWHIFILVFGALSLVGAVCSFLLWGLERFVSDDE